MSQYLTIDECINCQEEIGATGVSTAFLESYDHGGQIAHDKLRVYSWTHTRTQQGKCDNNSGLYAAGKKMPPQ